MKKFNKDKYLKKLKLKRFWQNNSRYFYVGISCTLCLVLGIYFAYSKFFVSSEEDVIQTKVGEFIYGDIVATPYIDGVYSSTFPEKKTGINVEKIVCDNGATATWDEEKWGLMVTNLSKRTKCNIYFVTPNSCGINNNVSCINSREGLVNLANEVNNGDSKAGKIIYLTSDLDLGGKFDSDGNALEGNISWTPIGTDTNSFSGTFDGNGHIISNMYINLPNIYGAGMFGNLKNGLIKNLGIISAFIIGDYNQAGIVGSGGTIKNCYSAAIVKGTARTAGICGNGCKIIDSYNVGNIINGKSDLSGGICGGWCTIHNSYNLGNVTSSASSVGGISGWSSEIYNSYNIGDVNGAINYTGGILGQSTGDDDNPSVLKNNYNVGKISGGGVLGTQYGVNSYSDFSTIVSKNYYLEGSANYGINMYKSNVGAEPLSEEEMPSVISVINGDNAFAEDTNNINNGYPILKWQAEKENN